jgi:hypothetical protein
MNVSSLIHNYIILAEEQLSHISISNFKHQTKDTTMELNQNDSLAADMETYNPVYFTFLYTILSLISIKFQDLIHVELEAERANVSLSDQRILQQRLLHERQLLKDQVLLTYRFSFQINEESWYSIIINYTAKQFRLSNNYDVALLPYSREEINPSIIEKVMKSSCFYKLLSAISSEIKNRSMVSEVYPVNNQLFDIDDVAHNLSSMINKRLDYVTELSEKSRENFAKISIEVTKKLVQSLF